MQENIWESRCTCGQRFNRLAELIQHSQEQWAAEMESNPRFKKNQLANPPKDLYGEVIERPQHEGHKPLPVANYAQISAKAIAFLLRTGQLETAME